MTSLADLQARGREIARSYDELNLARRGRTWTTEQTMLGFVGDVGDLAKLVMAAEGARSDVSTPEELAADLGHELADCLWVVLMLADRYGIDLAAAYERTMDDIERSLS